jgi:MiaB/RimO family radical SAM methylthiotransferase
MKTFSITTLGCRVNHYEAEQLATLLRRRGLVRASSPDRADLRIVHTCSVTTQAASKSRQSVRRATRLTVLNDTGPRRANSSCGSPEHPASGETNPEPVVCTVADIQNLSDTSSRPIAPSDAAEQSRSATRGRPRVIVTGCWATSDPKEAAALRGVDAVLGHHQDVDRELTHLLTQWEAEERASTAPTSRPLEHAGPTTPEPNLNDEWMMQQAGTRAGSITFANEPHARWEVNAKLECDEDPRDERNEVAARRAGTTSLPQLADRQSTHQRAFLKVQDGCDAHCTYCIIPRLRPTLWSKPVDDAVAEATRLTDAGHAEIVLTGIFLGAYGQPTALRRRQPGPTAGPLGQLVEALCTRVPRLRRLRLSSLEPGDVTPDLIRRLGRFAQVVPHFHLPLQSGSDVVLRRMNRQYTRTDFLDLVAQLHTAFVRPAITTDIITGFPGETDDEFARTLDVVDRVRFIRVHAFSYSARPGTAAARRTRDTVPAQVANARIHALQSRAAGHSLAFRRQFVNQTVRVLIEQGGDHGRCERYFDVHLDRGGYVPGTEVEARVDQVTPDATRAAVVGVLR